jgi:hypothetical protein
LAGDTEFQLKETCEDVVACSVAIDWMQTLQILIILLFLFKLSVRTGLIKRVRIKRKICGAEVLYELADLLNKCGLNWARTFGFVSDRALAVKS